MSAAASKRSNSKSDRSVLRRSARLGPSSTPTPRGPVTDEEHNLYLFLFCNYLVWKAGGLAPERVEDLNDLGIDWLSHVEDQEGIPAFLRECPMSKETATSIAIERFSDNSKLMDMFTEMMS
jgi:hypothetical protein